jgi:hypothetical protein
MIVVVVEGRWCLLVQTHFQHKTPPISKLIVDTDPAMTVGGMRRSGIGNTTLVTPVSNSASLAASVLTPRTVPAASETSTPVSNSDLHKNEDVVD